MAHFDESGEGYEYGRRLEGLRSRSRRQAAPGDNHCLGYPRTSALHVDHGTAEFVPFSHVKGLWWDPWFYGATTHHHHHGATVIGLSNYRYERFIDLLATRLLRPVRKSALEEWKGNRYEKLSTPGEN